MEVNKLLYCLIKYDGQPLESWIGKIKVLALHVPCHFQLSESQWEEKITQC